MIYLFKYDDFAFGKLILNFLENFIIFEIGKIMMINFWVFIDLI